jgi:hypothetical protein
MHVSATSFSTVLLSASTALAQAMPPVEGAPANTPNTTSGIGSYWWLFVIIVLAALAIWYFATSRNRT